VGARLLLSTHQARSSTREQNFLKAKGRAVPGLFFNHLRRNIRAVVSFARWRLLAFGRTSQSRFFLIKTSINSLRGSTQSTRKHELRPE
jgi:hypothetical protein